MSTHAKKLAQELHFCRRAKERFGFNITPRRYGRIIQQIEQVDEGVSFIGQSSKGRTVWSASFGGQRFRVVYDESTGCLVTCLPIGRTDSGDAIKAMINHDILYRAKRLKGCL